MDRLDRTTWEIIPRLLKPLFTPEDQKEWREVKAQIANVGGPFIPCSSKWGNSAPVHFPPKVRSKLVLLIKRERELRQMWINHCFATFCG